MRPRFLAGIASLLLVASASAADDGMTAASPAMGEPRWWKGNLHTHTLQATDILLIEPAGSCTGPFHALSCHPRTSRWPPRLPLMAPASAFREGHL